MISKWVLVLFITVFLGSNDGGAGVHVEQIKFFTAAKCEEAKAVLVGEHKKKWGLGHTLTIIRGDCVSQ